MLALEAPVDYGALSAEELALYVKLIRDGSLDALIKAGAIMPTAKSDAAAVKRVRQIIAARPDVAAARKRVEAADRELVQINDELARLQQRQAQLRAQRSDAQNIAASESGLRTRLTFETGSLAVRLACKPELEAVGIR